MKKLTTTTAAPNLGKFFTSCTKRPATVQDIALLSSGDWISEIDCPWSWQFKNSCQDMAVGVWEGKEFFVPHHLLMVCEVIEGQVVEKFFKKSEVQNLKTDFTDLKVGDCISILKTRTQNLSQWVGKTATVTGINGETISVAAGEGREKKHLTLKKGWYEVIPPESPENERTQQSEANKTISEKYYKGYRIEFFVLEDGEAIKFKIFNEQWKIYNYYHEYESLEEAELGAIEWLDRNHPGERVLPPSKDTIERMGGAVGLTRNAHSQQFKVGDRVIAYKGKPAASAVIHDARIENGCIQIIWDDVQDKSPRWFAVDVLRLEQELDKSTDTTSFSVGDRFAVCPGVSNECEIIGLCGRDKYRVRWSLMGDEQTVEATFLAELKSVQPDLDPEKLFNNQPCLQPDTSIVEAAGIPKEVLPQDTNPSGQLIAIPTPQPSTESDSPASDLLSKTSVQLQMNLFSDSQYQISAYSQHLVQIFPWLVSELGLLEFADNCFLKDSDLFDSNAQAHLCLKMLTDSLAQTKVLPSRKSSKRLQVWGIASPGNLGMVVGTSPKTEDGFSSWAITAEVKATLPKIDKKSLSDILGAIPINSFTKEQIDQAFTLRSSTPKQGVGSKSHPNTFLLQPAILDVHHASGGRLYEEESPCLLTPGEGGRKFSIVYRAAGGDRHYHKEAPTLRSLSNTGNHQSGSGAYKIREYQGETYLDRPINATEAEQLMGWEVGSTAIGIDKEGDEINISQTQRIKMLGNGIVPGEITDILTAIKPILERKLEAEVPENMRFAYRQLRQKGMSHSEALKLIHRF